MNDTNMHLERDIYVNYIGKYFSSKSHKFWKNCIYCVLTGYHDVKHKISCICYLLIKRKKPLGRPNILIDLILYQNHRADIDLFHRFDKLKCIGISKERVR